MQRYGTSSELEVGKKSQPKTDAKQNVKDGDGKSRGSEEGKGKDGDAKNRQPSPVPPLLRSDATKMKSTVQLMNFLSTPSKSLLQYPTYKDMDVQISNKVKFLFVCLFVFAFVFCLIVLVYVGLYWFVCSLFSPNTNIS
jgi:hypothetical protein